MVRSYNIFTPITMLIVIFINKISNISSNFYVRTDLSNFKNTQIASAAVCPKCLRLLANNNIGFYNCENNLDQFFTITLEDNDFGVYSSIKSRKYNIYAFPAERNINNNFGETLEIFPVDDDGGHSIQLVNTDLCVFHNHVLSNTNSNDYSLYLSKCNYTSRYFKFYFFKQLYLFPDYKVIGNSYEYTLSTTVISEPNLGKLIKEKTLINFVCQATQETRSIPFDPTSKKFEVQLYECNWNILITVSDSSRYHYKTDPPYYFPIVRCHEDKEYWADIPVRKFITEGRTAGASTTTIFRIKAKKDIIIKYLYGVSSWYNHCNIVSSYGAGNKTFSNIKISAGGCIMVQGNVDYSSKTDIDSFSSLGGFFNEVSYSSALITVTHGCEVKSNTLFERAKFKCCFTVNKWYDCRRGIVVRLDVWDNSVIKNDWDGKYS